MSVEDNFHVVNEVLKAVNARDWARYDELHAEAVVDYSPSNPEGSQGIDAVRESAQGIITAFPDMRGEVTHTFGQGDWVCTEVTFKGTHNGPLTGPGGETIPATNKPGRLDVCSAVRIEGGKLAEEHTYYDQLGLMAQLGLLPQGD